MAKQKSSKDPKQKGSKTWKIYGRVSTIAAGIAAARAVNLGWKAATGRQPPSSPESPDVAGKEAMLWAALTGAATGTAKLLATRKAATYWIKSTGHLPPGLTAEGEQELRKDLAEVERDKAERKRSLKAIFGR